jgi:hypothetical protein
MIVHRGFGRVATQRLGWCDHDTGAIGTSRELRDAFWNFWMEYRKKEIAIADCGAPVEAGLFRSCVEDDLPTREW